MRTVQWRAHNAAWKTTVDLFGFLDGGGDQIEILQPANFIIKRQDRHAVSADGPAFSLTTESAQTLLQALWDVGLRPNNGEGAPAESLALRRHIGFAEEMAKALLSKVPAPK